MKTKLFIFFIALAYFGFLAAPDVTWINTDSDSGIYLWSTKHLGLSHPTGAPVYNLIGYVLTSWTDDLRIRAHVLSLFSALCSALTTLVLFKETKKFIAPVIFMASGVVVSQSTIIETYALSTLIMVLLYYYRDTKWSYVLTAIMGIGVHHLIAFAYIPIVIYRWKEKKLQWTDLLVFTGILWYIYIFFAIKPDAGWSNVPWYKYFTGQQFLIGGLDIVNDGPLRLVDFVTLILGNMGIVLLSLTKLKDKLLIALILGPLIYYITGLPPQTYVYIMPSVAFAAISFSIFEHTMWIRATASIACLIVIGFNLYLYDIGKHLDPEPTSARMFLNQLEAIPEGSSVHVADRGYEGVMTWNIDKELTVGNLRKLNIRPDYVSVITEPERYGTTITPCDEMCKDAVMQETFIPPPSPSLFSFRNPFLSNNYRSSRTD